MNFDNTDHPLTPGSTIRYYGMDVRVVALQGSRIAPDQKRTFYFHGELADTEHNCATKARLIAGCYSTRR